MVMKKILLAAALAAVIATPTMAKDDEDIRENKADKAHVVQTQKPLMQPLMQPVSPGIRTEGRGSSKEEDKGDSGNGHDGGDKGK
jgi:hypothetical protein